MNILNKFFIGSAVAFSISALLSSCAMDAPFGEGAEGSLTINTDIRGDVVKTRAAVSGDELASLREKCVVYIENNKGVIRKWKGLDNIPESIKLRTGSYVAEAWSGDSVSASFDAKFYRGYQKFEMNEGANSLTLKCNIANVLVSVDPVSLDVNLSDLKVTFSHSRGLLEFTEANISDGAKGYFMMPNADKDLAYKVEGKKADGSLFSKEGKIENVQRAHEYCMNLSEEARPVEEGGALIRLSIADIPVINEEVEIFPAPAVSGVGFDVAEQVVNTDRNFSDIKVCVLGYFGFSSLVMNVNIPDAGIVSGQNILETSVKTSLEQKGVKMERIQSKDAASSADGEEVLVDKVYVTFSKAFLDALPESEQEYVFSFEGTDNHHKTGRGSLRIANSFGAIEQLPPVSTGAAPDVNLEPMAIGARRATLTGYINDAAAALNFGIKYRKEGASGWNEAYPTSAAAAAARRAARGTRALEQTPYVVALTGLEPGVNYEFKAFCDGYEGADVNRFTTESVFTIPNYSFEEWGTYDGKTALGTTAKGIVVPGTTGDKYTSFWGSGNEGGATAKITMTNKSTDMVHSGTYSARLASASALGMLAAGNIFVGEYEKAALSGGNAVGYINMGREYNGSHPTALRAYINYRPGTVGNYKANSIFTPDFVEGGSDHGQIYVALSDQIVNVVTDPNDNKFFNPDAENILAYGEMTFKDAFGPDGALKEINIPLIYRERAKTVRPKYLLITCCASKYGDYFSGSTTSVLYLDDVELIYE